MVEMNPPPSFQAAAPAKIPRNGPCIVIISLKLTKIKFKSDRPKFQICKKDLSYLFAAWQAFYFRAYKKL